MRIYGWKYPDLSEEMCIMRKIGQGGQDSFCIYNYGKTALHVTSRVNDKLTQCNAKQTLTVQEPCDINHCNAFITST